MSKIVEVSSAQSIFCFFLKTAQFFTPFRIELNEEWISKIVLKALFFLFDPINSKILSIYTTIVLSKNILPRIKIIPLRRIIIHQIHHTPCLTLHKITVMLRSFLQFWASHPTLDFVRRLPLEYVLNHGISKRLQ